MGNKIGFEADAERVKLAYIQQEEQHLQFIQMLNSKFLRYRLKCGKSTIFLFECTTQEFMAYPQTQNLKLLYVQYSAMFDQTESIKIRTNRATINILKENKTLYSALAEIMRKDFQLEHAQRIQSSVSAMHILEKEPSTQFFHFLKGFKITELHCFHQSYVAEMAHVQGLPDKFLLVILRNGIVAYLIEKGKKIQRIDGSVIGEKTITSILKFKYPQLSVQECFDMAFGAGDLKKVDLMVEDIYGKNTHNLGLPSDIIASSMGKYAKLPSSCPSMPAPADFIRSLITTFAINTSNLIGLYLSRTKLQTAVILGDNFHNQKFYSLLQVCYWLCRPFVVTMHQARMCYLLSILHSWDVLALSLVPKRGTQMKNEGTAWKKGMIYLPFVFVIMHAFLGAGDRLVGQGRGQGV